MNRIFAIIIGLSVALFVVNGFVFSWKTIGGERISPRDALRAGPLKWLFPLAVALGIVGGLGYRVTWWWE